MMIGKRLTIFITVNLFIQQVSIVLASFPGADPRLVFYANFVSP